jgi:hypothetical protein
MVAVTAWPNGRGERHENVASKYEYTTEVKNVQPFGDEQYVARVRLEGNFPGGTVDLRYQFDIDGDRIQRLEIT